VDVVVNAPKVPPGTTADMRGAQSGFGGWERVVRGVVTDVDSVFRGAKSLMRE
jgi:hypothetical protein